MKRQYVLLNPLQLSFMTPYPIQVRVACQKCQSTSLRFLTTLSKVYIESPRISRYIIYFHLMVFRRRWSGTIGWCLASTSPKQPRNSIVFPWCLSKYSCSCVASSSTSRPYTCSYYFIVVCLNSLHILSSILLISTTDCGLESVNSILLF